MIRQCPHCTYPLKVIVDLKEKVRITVCSNKRCDYQRVRKIRK